MLDGDVKLATCYFEKRRPLLYFLPFKNEEEGSCCSLQLKSGLKLFFKAFQTHESKSNLCDSYRSSSSVSPDLLGPNCKFQNDGC